MLKKKYIFLIPVMICCLFSLSVKAENSFVNSLWESGKISSQILSFDTADVLHDGTYDLIYCTRDKIFVAKFDQNSIRNVLEMSLGKKREFHRVTVGDWDADGTIEILINGFVREQAYSWLYHIENKQLYLEQEFEMLVMPLTLQNQTKLYAQKLNVNGEWADFIKPLELQQGQWRETANFIKINRGIGGNALSLFSMIGFKDKIVAMNSENKILMLNQKGKAVWKSSMRYGTAVDFITRREKDALGLKKEKRYFLPPRMMVKDDHLIVIKNESYLGSIVGSVPNIKFSQIVTLAHTGAGFQEIKTTTRFPGAVTDAKFVYFDGDDQPEIMLGFLLKKMGYLDGYRGLDSIIAVRKE